MSNGQKKQQSAIGMVGLGVTGRNLLLNMADNGFPVAGYDKDPEKVEALRVESNGLEVACATNVEDPSRMLRITTKVITMDNGYRGQKTVCGPPPGILNLGVGVIELGIA